MCGPRANNDSPQRTIAFSIDPCGLIQLPPSIAGAGYTLAYRCEHIIEILMSISEEDVFFLYRVPLRPHWKSQPPTAEGVVSLEKADRSKPLETLKGLVVSHREWIPVVLCWKVSFLSRTLPAGVTEPPRGRHLSAEMDYATFRFTGSSRKPKFLRETFVYDSLKA